MNQEPNQLEIIEEWQQARSQSEKDALMDILIEMTNFLRLQNDK